MWTARRGAKDLQQLQRNELIVRIVSRGVTIMDAAEPDVLAYMTFPKEGTRFCAPFRLSRLLERDPRSRGSAFRSFLAEWQISDLLAANRSFTPCKSVRLER